MCVCGGGGGEGGGGWGRDGYFNFNQCYTSSKTYTHTPERNMTTVLSSEKEINREIKLIVPC